MMYQHSTKSSYKYVSLDLAHLNQKKKSARRSLQQLRDYGPTYGLDFNIQNSWVQNSGKTVDTLKDSMMAYSKRMSDIRKIRGINAARQSGPTVGVPALWINTGKGSLQLNMLDDNSRKYYTTHNRVSKSLGTIKLEPLLGSRRVSTNRDTDNVPPLQTHTMRKEVPLSLDEQANGPVKVRHITVTITIPPPETQEEEEDESSASENNQEISATNLSPPRIPRASLNSPSPPKTSPPSGEEEWEILKKKLVPLGSGRARPRKAKRMKITEPSLEPINEDIDETNSIYTHDIEEEYYDLLNDLHNSQEQMLEQKRKTVALLRQTNYAQRSHQQNRQLAMASLAKRKFKRLPPIPTGRLQNPICSGVPSLRHSSSRTENMERRSSPYDQSIDRHPPPPVRSGMPSLRYTTNTTEGARRRSPYDESIDGEE